MNREVALEFLRALTGSDDPRVTFQTFTDGDDKDGPAPTIIHGYLDEETAARLADLQEHGHGVFVAVNETDGYGRRERNIIGLRALVADDDTNSVSLTKLPIEPNIVVESSGRGRHYYFLLQPGENLADYTKAQKALAEKLGTDPKVCDITRVMRLPGTYHLKDRAHPHEVKCWVTHRDRRTIRDVLGALGTSLPEEKPAVAPEPSSPGRRLASNSKDRCAAYVAQIRAVSGEGGDADTFRVGAICLNDFGLDLKQAWQVFEAWNKTNCAPPWTREELQKKFRNAQRYGKPKPKPDRELGQGESTKMIREARNGELPDHLDPKRYCFDMSQSAAWRFYSGTWTDGIPESNINRMLENDGGLDKGMIRDWKQMVKVVQDARPVYSSHEPFALVESAPVANTYRPSTLFPKPGDWSAAEAILRNLCNNDEEAFRWVMGWLGKVVQNVFEGKPARVGTAPVFFGAKGAGKGVLEELCKAMLGPWNVVSITQTELDSQFNSWLDGQLLVFANEVWTSDTRSHSSIARIKDMITCHDRTVNRKGIPQYKRKAVENWIFASNNARPVEVERGDRRFTVIRTGGPIDPEQGALVADDARAGGPIVQALYAHLLALPAADLVADYKPLVTKAKHDVERASGNSATKFAREVAARGFFSLTAPWEEHTRRHVRELFLRGKAGALRSVRSCPGQPLILTRDLMQVYRAYAQEIGAPMVQETTLLAALQEEFPGLHLGEVQHERRVERAVTGLPEMLPPGLVEEWADPESLPSETQTEIPF